MYNPEEFIAEVRLVGLQEYAKLNVDFFEAAFQEISLAKYLGEEGPRSPLEAAFPLPRGYYWTKTRTDLALAGTAGLVSQISRAELVDLLNYKRHRELRLKDGY